MPCRGAPVNPNSGEAALRAAAVMRGIGIPGSVVISFLDGKRLPRERT